jgi:hypothetical protein
LEKKKKTIYYFYDDDNIIEKNLKIDILIDDIFFLLEQAEEVELLEETELVKETSNTSEKVITCENNKINNVVFNTNEIDEDKNVDENFKNYIEYKKQLFATLDLTLSDHEKDDENNDEEFDNYLIEQEHNFLNMDLNLLGTKPKKLLDDYNLNVDFDRVYAPPTVRDHEREGIF